MVEFSGDIALILEVLALGLGLVIWHWASKEKANILYVAGGFLAVAAFLSMLCTGYSYVSFWRHGAMGRPGMMGGGVGPGMRMPMHENMMQNMNKCMAGMQGQVMDETKMKQMHECMMGQKETDK